MSRQDAEDAADAALARLSPAAREVAGRSQRRLKLWKRLVKKVGADSAVELMEVTSLIAMIAAVDRIVGEQMRRWRDGLVRNPDAVDAVITVTEDANERVGSAIDAVNRVATSEEARRVATTGASYYPNIRSAALFFLLMENFSEPYLTDQQLMEATTAKDRWEVACREWDAVSGRRSLPLVGD